MPELPEVETVRAGLAPAMEGSRIVAVDQRRPDLRFPFPDQFTDRLVGRRIEKLGRRAKFLTAHLEGGDVLIMHLGMSGRFTVTYATVDKLAPINCTGMTPGQFVHSNGRIPAHDHIVFELSSGVRVTFNDPRRFGYMDLVAASDLENCRHFARLGVEPLSPGFSGQYLAMKARGRTGDLKAFLLDQHIVAGLGNIYVCEALYRARLSPRSRAGMLATGRGKSSVRAERLVTAIKQVLSEAITAGGSTLRDYAHTDGALGYFQHSFRVYGREGAPCPDEMCNQAIKRIVQAGRSTFYCASCQRAR